MLLESADDIIRYSGFEGLSVEEIAELLGDEQIDFLLNAQQAENDYERFGKFDYLFPETTRQIGSFTAWSRHLYAKHMEFFTVGATTRSRCFMAANRVGKCRTYNGLVQHPDGTTSKIGDLFVKGERFKVMAWSGSQAVEAYASAVIRKPPEQTVEVVLSDGHTFTASLDHLVLTDQGYEFLADVLLFSPCLPASSGEPDPLTHGANDLHWSQTVQDLKDRYSADYRQCGEQPLDAVEIVRYFAPSRNDALQRNPVSLPSGPLAHECNGSPSLSALRPSLSALRPSSRYATLRCVARSFAFLTQAAYTSARHNTCSRQGVGRLHAASIALSRSVRAGLRGLFGRRALVSPHAKATNKVVAYRPAGIHALYDMTVPAFHNYIADGIVHHNTFSAGGYEMACHLTGKYPEWWPGRRFKHPIRAWACGKTFETTRDIVQTTLLGEIEFQGPRKLVDGSGVIPRDCIGLHQGSITWKSGVVDMVDTIKIKHVSGGWSKLGFKAYAQGRGAFEGTAQHVIWDDEEPPLDVYGEQVIRTATTKGLMMITFTPLAGMSEVVQQFLPDDDLVIG